MGEGTGGLEEALEGGGGRLLVALIRHGQTAWNVERRFLGKSDVPLDETGVAQVGRLASLAGRFGAVYSSPLSRARSTALAFHPDPILVPGLAELDQGEFEGLTHEEAGGRFPEILGIWLGDPVATAPPGGETMEICRDRGLAALRDAVSRHGPGERIALVSHQVVISTVTCTIAGRPLSRWREFAVPNTAMNVLAWDGDRFSIVAARAGVAAG